MTSVWPLFDLRVRTRRLQLRVPDRADLEALAALAVDGVHNPAYMPFIQPWTDAPVDELPGRVLQHHWAGWAAWSPDSWRLNLVVVADGVVVGSQGLSGKDFGVLRELGTGSWLGLRHQGRGYGTEMRAAVLHLGFAGLGAQHATSGAFEDNVPSLAVSHRLGYVDNGFNRYARRGVAATEIRLRLSRADWERHRTEEVTIEGLQRCLPMFGAGTR